MSPAKISKTDMKRIRKAPAARATSRLQKVLQPSALSRERHILELPTEILVRILAFVGGHHTRYLRLLFLKYHSDKNTLGDEHLGPLLVCREFYYAGLQAFYSGVVFQFLEVKHLRAVLRDFSASRLRSIRHIALLIWFTRNPLLDAERNPAARTRETRAALLKVHREHSKSRASSSRFVLYSLRDISSDPLSSLPCLESVRLMISIYDLPHDYDHELNSETISDMERMVKAAWPSKADIIDVEWPRRYMWPVRGLQCYRHDLSQCTEDCLEPEQYLFDASFRLPMPLPSKAASPITSPEQSAH